MRSYNNISDIKKLKLTCIHKKADNFTLHFITQSEYMKLILPYTTSSFVFFQLRAVQLQASFRLDGRSVSYHSCPLAHVILFAEYLAFLIHVRCSLNASIPRVCVHRPNVAISHAVCLLAYLSVGLSICLSVSVSPLLLCFSVYRLTFLAVFLYLSLSSSPLFALQSSDLLGDEKQCRQLPTSTDSQPIRPICILQTICPPR